MNITSFSLCIILSLFLYIIPCKTDTCGNVGEDYYVLNKFEYTHFDDFANASSPNWLFTPFNYWNNETLMNSACHFITNTCGDLNYGECELFDFQNLQTYEFVCEILDVSATQQMIDQLTKIHFGDPNATDDCFCSIPSTPSGKHINGITLNVHGRVEFSTVSLSTSPCTVQVSYQNSPLKPGDQFTQKIILNGKKQQAKWWVPRLVIIVVGLMLFSASCTVIGVMIERRKRKNKPYTLINDFDYEEEVY